MKQLLLSTIIGLLMFATPVFASEADDLFLQGQVFASQKIYDQAMLAYQEALALEPEHERARISLAILYGLRQEYDKGLKEISLVQKLYPKSYVSYKVQGILYKDAKLFQKSAESFEKYLTMAPEGKIKDRKEIEELVKTLYAMPNTTNLEATP